MCFQIVYHIDLRLYEVHAGLLNDNANIHFCFFFK